MASNFRFGNIPIEEIDAKEVSYGTGRDMYGLSDGDLSYGTGRDMYGLEGECCLGELGESAVESNELLQPGFACHLGELEGSFTANVLKLMAAAKAKQAKQAKRQPKPAAVASVSAVASATAKMPWMMGAVAIGGQMSSAQVKPLARPVSRAVARKAAEVVEGGFVGGKIGKAAKKTQATMLKRAELLKKLAAAAARAQSPEEAVDLRNKVNQAAAGIVTDRARIERFRYVSVLKTYAVMKKEHEQAALDQLKQTSDPMGRAKLMAEARASAELAKRSHSAANTLLTTKLHVEGLNEMVAALRSPRKLHQFGPEAQQRAAAERAARPCEMTQTPMPYWTGMDEMDLGGALDSVRKGLSYVKKGVSKAVDFAAYAGPTLAKIAEVAGPIASGVGTTAMMTPIPPVSQAAGAVLLVAGAGITAAASAAKPAIGAVKTIKDVKDTVDQALALGDLEAAKAKDLPAPWRNIDPIQSGWMIPPTKHTKGTPYPTWGTFNKVLSAGDQLPIGQYVADKAAFKKRYGNEAAAHAQDVLIALVRKENKRAVASARMARLLTEGKVEEARKQQAAEQAEFEKQVKPEVKPRVEPRVEPEKEPAAEGASKLPLVALGVGGVAVAGVMIYLVTRRK